MDDTLLLTLRMMAWQRAKGELNSILETYHGFLENFELAEAKIETFIKDFEDECC
jgi:hypothetical protein